MFRAATSGIRVSVTLQLNELCEEAQEGEANSARDRERERLALTQQSVSP